jgi:hypothetical protein
MATMSTAKSAVDFLGRVAAASAAMTVSQHVEIAITHRAPSDLPVRVFERLTGITVARGVARIVAGQIPQGGLAAQAVGVARQTQHLPAVPAVLLNVSTLVVSNAVIAGALGLSDMPWRWSAGDIGTDLLHKTSLALAAHVLTRSRAAAAA